MASPESLEQPTAATTFHGFGKLPAEIRLMVWKAALPRRGISLMSDRDARGLAPPAMVHVCRESRYVYFKGRNVSPRSAMRRSRKNSVGWFDPDVDVLIFQAFRDALTDSYFMCQSVARLLPTVTIWDYLRGDWSENVNPRTYEKIIDKICSLEEYDNNRLAPWFDAILEGRVKLKTLNFFRHDYRSFNSFIIDNSRDSPAVARLFGNDSVLVLDLMDEANINRVLSILKSHPSTQDCAKGLEVTYDRLKLSEFERWTELQFEMKFLWLSKAYKMDVDKGLSAVNVSTWETRLYWDGFRKVVWDEEDPWISKTLKKMPEAKLVYILMTRD
ncbi:hypothetical protein AAE478_003165 [Parahypoxylon ruwenzoriense]